MQVVLPFFSNKSSIKSIIYIQDSSLLSSSSSSNSDFDDTIFNSHKNINDATVLNYGTLYKTAASPTYTVNSNLRTENQEFNKFGYISSYFQRNPYLMHDDNKMAGTNSKRYLHNKVGDRKRRRPDSAFSGSSEMEESVLVDTLGRPKQTTRQSLQKHLTSAPISLEKSNRTEQLISTCGSKKYLRSNRQDTEQCCDYIECSLANLNKSGVENVSQPDVDVSNTTCNVNSDSLKIKVNKLENDESLKDVENINFKNLVAKKHIASKKDDSEYDETKQINNLEVKTNDKNDNNSDSNKSSPKFYQSDATHIGNYNALGCQNRNNSNNVFTINATNLIAESLDEAVNPIGKLENKSSLDDTDKNDTMIIEGKNETNNFTTTSILENVSPISPRPPLCSLNDDNETQDIYEDHLHQISNSLCLENSLSSNSCCKVSMEDRKKICNNESKPELDTNETKLSNLMNLSQTNSKTHQQECDVSKSQRDDEHCPNFDSDDNTALPTLSTYNIARLCVRKSDAPCNRFEDIGDDLQVENIAYRKDVDNKQEKKDIRQSINTEEPQNINVDKNYNNTDSSLENDSKKDGGDNGTPKADVEFNEAQPTARHSNHQQLENDIIEAADKVYTQIEEHYRHHQQQNVTPISSDYELIIANHQQQSRQQDHEESRQSHNLNLTHQQDSPLQQSIHQQQQPYSTSQMYQLQQQNNHQQLHLQHQNQIHKQIELQQHHHNISLNTQRESGQQEHSHLMEFLHPQHHSSNNIQSPLHQQQHQIHEVYHDLMMDEFHDEHHTPYKLGLSPSTVKHENQDDGYETSAGDVLTPNSHTSSTHSVTPQHHLQQSSGGGFATNVSKCEEQHHQQQTHNLHLQQSHNCNLINEQIMQQELTPNESSRNLTPRDTFHFIDDDLNSPNNTSLRNILTPPHSHSQLRVGNQEGGRMNGFLAIQSDIHSNILNSGSDIYGLPNSNVNHHLSQKQADVEPISTTVVTNTDHQQHFLVSGSDITSHDPDSILNLQAKSMQKKRGRKKKILQEVLLPTLERTNLNDVNTTAGYIKAKERKKHDRFNGMSEEEIVKRILPDHLCENLDIVIIGINPGLFAAYKGHHYAGPGNHFWKCLYLSGLTQEQMNADEDFKLVKYGIGFTNMVQRATKGSADLTRKEIKEGSRILLEKLQRFRPKIAVFNGKLIFEVFSGKKDFNFGRQPECVEGTDTFIWVMPSSSARCAQLPRAADKVPFYAALKKFRDYLNGLIPHIDQSECVFTEERIKQQCEQQNYKNQQNNICGGNSFSNTVGICNSDRALQSNTFDSESKPHNVDGGPGPPPTSTGGNNGSTSFMMSSLVGSQHEKKKRGRPKKIKGQEIIDPITGNKIQINTQILTPGNEEYSNILNLSVSQVANSEAPKKKRGRPKKLKLPTSTLEAGIVQSSSVLSQKPKILSIHSMTNNGIQDSPHHMQHIQQNHQHTSLYSTPPPQHQGNIYSPMVSPMASPSVNCSYTTNTPPSQQNNDKLVLTGSETKSSKTTTEVLGTSQHSINEQNFCESPPPNSPNICSVDFNPPTSSAVTSLSAVSDNVNSEINSIHHQPLESNQKSRFNSQTTGDATPDHNTNTEHFQQWLSPQHNVHSPAAATVVSNTMFTSSPQQISLNYHDQQQQQVQAVQQQEIHAQWPLRHQSRYDDSPYLLNSSVYQIQPHHHDDHQQQQNQGGSDVARKSLSGLESLVDQIPTISESESVALSSAALVNAQIAAAAAVESRLQNMQNSSNNDTQVGEDSHFSAITGSTNLLTTSSSPSSASSTNNQMQQSSSSTSLLSNNFSVSSLAESSASSNNNIANTNITNQEDYGLSSNSRPLTNTNAYHHPNLMAAAVLAAAAANSPSNLSSSSASASAAASHHAQMYMDPHAHLTTHVPINSIYPTTSHHHHSAVAAHHHHHSAAVHYNSGPHAATDYAANSLYTTPQSNVTTGHTLHMPSPNYPYGYSTATSQSNYSAYSHTHANHHHGHPHSHHTAHHLGIFDRLKPSDITGYGSGF